MRFRLTSVMIIIAGASLSEQHTDLLICHCTKQDSSRTSRYLRIISQQPGQLQSMCLHIRAGASYFRLVRPCGVKKLGGSGGMLPQENFKIRHSEMASEAMFGPKCY